MASLDGFSYMIFVEVEFEGPWGGVVEAEVLEWESRRYPSYFFHTQCGFHLLDTRSLFV
jgi:hypothetical protein